MTNDISGKIKEWRDTHFPIHIPLTCLGLGILVTILISNAWLEPERANDLKKVCPTISEDCLNTLAWEPNPLYFFIPMSFTAAGFIIGNAVRSTA